MNDDIRIWEVGDPSKAAKPVESTNRMETEALLEGLLVGNPDMLMPGLTLVGRQMPTDSGFLDLLGVDGDGRLVVFELKRAAQDHTARQRQCLRLPFGGDRPVRRDTRDLLSGSDRRVLGEVQRPADNGPVQVRDATQCAADEASPGAVVLSVGQDDMGDAQQQFPLAPRGAAPRCDFDPIPAVRAPDPVRLASDFGLGGNCWTHKEALAVLANDVHGAWREIRRRGAEA